MDISVVKRDGVWRALSLRVTRGNLTDETPPDTAPPDATPLDAAWQNFQANGEGKISVELRNKQPGKISVRLTREGQSSDYVPVEKE
ncbi:MAG: hypothetical protein FGM15_04235 [Chthoniobacterales bacterium]|nr:hypothetical protein [Chthoniobacterales bacterium]